MLLKLKYNSVECIRPPRKSRPLLKPHVNPLIRIFIWKPPKEMELPPRWPTTHREWGWTAAGQAWGYSQVPDWVSLFWSTSLQLRVTGGKALHVVCLCTEQQLREHGLLWVSGWCLGKDYIWEAVVLLGDFNAHIEQWWRNLEEHDWEE